MSNLEYVTGQTDSNIKYVVDKADSNIEYVVGETDNEYCLDYIEDSNTVIIIDAAMCLKRAWYSNRILF
jgi:hypothetical protein